MTYGQRPVCRRGGCGADAVPSDGLIEGDKGWCEWHLAEVRKDRGFDAGGDGRKGGSHRGPRPENHYLGRTE